MSWNSLFSAASPVGASSSSASSSASSLSQSVGRFVCAAFELGYAGRDIDASEKLSGCVAFVFSRASAVRSLHWIASLFRSRSSTLATPTTNFESAGTMPPKRRMGSV